MPWNWFRARARKPTAGLELGERGEDCAARFLKQEGYKILARRFKSRSGEIDLVAQDGDWLVFVEVKTRRSEQHGTPSESVDYRKQKQLAKTALDYLGLLKHPEVRFRFDIVEVILASPEAAPSDIRLIQDAFEMPGPYTY